MIAQVGAAPLAFSPESDLCGDCLASSGKLCRRHEREVLPQLARNIGWLKLMGEARTEQTKRQRGPKALPISPEGQAHIARQATARVIARSKRRGMYGLLRAIQGRKTA